VNINHPKQNFSVFYFYESFILSFDNILLKKFVSEIQNYLLEKLIFKNITNMYLFTFTPHSEMNGILNHPSCFSLSLRKNNHQQS